MWDWSYSGIDDLILKALKEDIGTGDVTTEALIDINHKSRGQIIAKQDVVVAGNPVAARVFNLVDPGIVYQAAVEEGAKLSSGQVIADIHGNSSALMKAERTALNFLQRLSGIATLTDQFVEAVAGTQAKIVETKKTTPGFRILEKYAVRTGGGYNHRIGLFDGILIKDNHIALSGGITEAVGRARRNASHFLKVEVEVKSMDEVKESLAAKADIIMLDNMNLEQIHEAIALIEDKALIEVSGGVDLNTVTKIAESGVDIISCGALTHSAPAADLSMIII